MKLRNQRPNYTGPYDSYDESGTEYPDREAMKLRKLVWLCEHDELKPHPIERSGFFKLGECPGGVFLPDDTDKLWRHGDDCLRAEYGNLTFQPFECDSRECGGSWVLIVSVWEAE